MINERRYLFMGTLVTGAIVALCILLAIRSMVINKKNGKSLQCGCDCSKSVSYTHLRANETLRAEV